MSSRDKQNSFASKNQTFSYKLLDHIVNSPNTLVNKIYINTEKTNKWVTTIKEWINKLGIGHLKHNTNNSKFYINSIQQRIPDQAKQNMNSLINVCEKLKCFREIHKSGERPPYIDICKLKSDRSLLCKFRLGAHSLAIQNGRYSNIERQNPFCYVIREKLRTNIISFQLVHIIYL